MRRFGVTFAAAMVLVAAGSGVAIGSHPREGVQQPVQAKENAGRAKVEIVWYCPEEKPGRVDYQTQDGSAVADLDYQHVSAVRHHQARRQSPRRDL
jgi:hypothetical protein